MYIPATFNESRPEVLCAFIRQYSFGTLVSLAEDGLTASHIPFMLDESRGGHGVLRAHVARPNPQWKNFAAGSDVLAIFQGPHAYISPKWYQIRETVPTWNYAVVHAYGRPRVLDDPADVHRLLVDTVDTFDTAVPGEWRLSDLPSDDFIKLARGIVAFEIEITRLQGKFKLNQNRCDVDRAGVVEALSQSPDCMGRAIADLMREPAE